MDAILHDIYSLKKKFITKYVMSPTTVYVGREEYYDLMHQLDHVEARKNGKTAVFGLDIIEVALHNHLSLGIIVEEDDNNGE